MLLGIYIGVKSPDFKDIVTSWIKPLIGKTEGFSIRIVEKETDASVVIHEASELLPPKSDIDFSPDPDKLYGIFCFQGNEKNMSDWRNVVKFSHGYAWITGFERFIKELDFYLRLAGLIRLETKKRACF